MRYRPIVFGPPPGERPKHTLYYDEFGAIVWPHPVSQADFAIRKFGGQLCLCFDQLARLDRKTMQDPPAPGNIVELSRVRDMLRFRRRMSRLPPPCIDDMPSGRWGGRYTATYKLVERIEHHLLARGINVVPYEASYLGIGLSGDGLAGYSFRSVDDGLEISCTRSDGRRATLPWNEFGVLSAVVFCEASALLSCCLNRQRTANIARVAANSKLLVDWAFADLPVSAYDYFRRDDLVIRLADEPGSVVRQVVLNHRRVALALAGLPCVVGENDP
jgi:hypothetical protein